MNDFKLGAVESRFADLIWQNEPIARKKLSKDDLDQLQRLIDQIRR